MKAEFLNIDEVVTQTDLPRSTVYWLMSESLFPRPVHTSPRRARWLKSDLAKWLAERIKERDAKEVSHAA
jgi:predicted DNA-binding transcriptional regulator AlpA